jgi:hypothetical protein
MFKVGDRFIDPEYPGFVWTIEVIREDALYQLSDSNGWNLLRPKEAILNDLVPLEVWNSPLYKALNEK